MTANGDAIILARERGTSVLEDVDWASFVIYGATNAEPAAVVTRDGCDHSPPRRSAC